MNRKKAPYLFLLFLIMVIIFILGTRYGKKVEESDKIISYIKSLTPSPLPSPSTTLRINSVSSALEFITYTHKGCGISFLYPSTLQVEKESTSGANLTDGKNTVLSLDCFVKNTKPTPTPQPSPQATTSITWKNKPMTVKVESQNGGEYYSFSLSSLDLRKIIGIQVKKDFYPLLESSFKLE